MNIIHIPDVPIVLDGFLFFPFKKKKTYKCIITWILVVLWIICNLVTKKSKVWRMKPGPRSVHEGRDHNQGKITKKINTKD